MKVAVCTVPKSGTYLISNFLKEIGLQDSFKHYNDEEYSDYSGASLKHARSTPEDFRVIEDFEQGVKEIRDNEFFVGHFSTSNRIHIEDFKQIFLYRNLKDCAVSFCFWTYHTGRWQKNEKDKSWREISDKSDFVALFLEEHGKSLKILFEKTVKWHKENNVLKICFENLVGDSGRNKQIDEFKKITDYLKIEISKIELETKIANTLNKKSLTKIAQKKNYKKYQTKRFNKILNKLGILKLNKNLGFKNEWFTFNKTKLSFYDKYWKKNKTTNSNWSYGIHIVNNLIDNYNFETVLDAGCGAGDVVRYLIEKGYDAKGIELSSYAIKNNAMDLIKNGTIKNASLLDIPFNDNFFDVTFSSEVLEHIHEEDIPKVIRELYRVTNTMLFLTISLRPSSNFNKYHITLRSRKWWEDQFKDEGFKLLRDDINSFQKIKPNANNEDVLNIGPTKTHIHEMQWFIEDNPYDLKGEIEPWYFIFKK
jgi:ubiquinone/menaquinone biosynthesis C-methylase UbiE